MYTGVCCELMLGHFDSSIEHFDHLINISSAKEFHANC